MAMRSALAPLSAARPVLLTRGVIRCLSDKGRVLSEEERAQENVYIQKMERERLEKQKRKAEKEKALEKGEAEKKPEGKGSA